MEAPSTVWIEPPFPLHELPREPGVYRMLDEKRTTLYVGKARNLLRRVSSYFQRPPESPRIRAMVHQIRYIECDITASEADALRLEHNLIKQLRPRYNVLLKDAKSYPYILLSDEAWPRLRLYRGRRDRPGTYYGPFPHTTAVHETIQVLHTMFRLRSCDDTEFRNRSRPCMQHQIGRCTAPCCGLVEQDEYRRQVEQARCVLDGRDHEIMHQWQTEMQEAAARMAFERAAVLRDRIRDLQRILGAGNEQELPRDADAIMLLRRPSSVLLATGIRRHGRDLGVHILHARQAVEADDQEILQSLLIERYRREAPPPHILLRQSSNTRKHLRRILRVLHPDHPLTLSSPRAEAETQWLARIRKSADEQAALRETDQSPAFRALGELLELPEAPRQLAAVDNAHIGGRHTVGAIVYGGWQGLEKQHYRRLRLDEVPAGDDYTAMRLLLGRMFEAMKEGRLPIPDILVIDGGIGQLSAAREAMQRHGGSQCPKMLAMAKGEKRKTGYETLWLDWLRNSDGTPKSLCPGPHDTGLLLLARVRDEAHRFAGEYMRKRKTQGMLRSELERIPGIGEGKRQALLRHFGGIQGVREASRQQLAQVPGISHTLAERIFTTLHR